MRCLRQENVSGRSERLDLSDFVSREHFNRETMSNDPGRHDRRFAPMTATSPDQITVVDVLLCALRAYGVKSVIAE